MKLILDSENSHPTTITVKGKEITLLLIESSILIDSSQIAKLFDKKEKTVATKVQKSKLEKYETESWNGGETRKISGNLRQLKAGTKAESRGLMLF